MTIESYHKRLQVNIWQLLPKIETNVDTNDDILISSNPFDRHETFELKECKVESSSICEWDNQQADSDYESVCIGKANIPEAADTKAKAKVVPAPRQNEFPCDWCESIFKTQDGLDGHYDTTHNTTLYECDLCGAR